jgi:phosphoglycolate phosphatase
MALPEVPSRLWGEPGTAVATEYVRFYQAKADEVMTDLTRVLPGVPQALEALMEQGLLLAIVSQKLRRRIEEVLVRDGLKQTFGAIIGGDQLTRLKPDPEGLLAAVAAVEAESAIYVGDTTIDAEAAGRAGLPFVAVLTGVTTKEEMEAYTPSAILLDVGALPDFCRRWRW